MRAALLLVLALTVLAPAVAVPAEAHHACDPELPCVPHPESFLCGPELEDILRKVHLCP